jgi:hypothetical protein
MPSFAPCLAVPIRTWRPLGRAQSIIAGECGLHRWSGPDVGVLNWWVTADLLQVLGVECKDYTGRIHSDNLTASNRPGRSAACRQVVRANSDAAQSLYSRHRTCIRTCSSPPARGTLLASPVAPGIVNTHAHTTMCTCQHPLQQLLLCVLVELLVLSRLPRAHTESSHTSTSARVTHTHVARNQFHSCQH